MSIIRNHGIAARRYMLQMQWPKIGGSMMTIEAARLRVCVIKRSLQRQCGAPEISGCFLAGICNSRALGGE